MVSPISVPSFFLANSNIKDILWLDIEKLERMKNGTAIWRSMDQWNHVDRGCTWIPNYYLKSARFTPTKFYSKTSQCENHPVSIPINRFWVLVWNLAKHEYHMATSLISERNTKDTSNLHFPRSLKIHSHHETGLHVEQILSKESFLSSRLHSFESIRRVKGSSQKGGIML